MNRVLEQIPTKTIGGKGPVKTYVEYATKKGVKRVLLKAEAGTKYKVKDLETGRMYKINKKGKTLITE